MALEANITVVRTADKYEATVTSKYGTCGPVCGTSPDEALGAAVRELWLGGDLDGDIRLHVTGDAGEGHENDGVEYELCARCHHFVDFAEETTERGVRAGYVHLDDGEQDYDHAAEPSGVRKALREWKKERPELFRRYPDGRIGPNSVYHEQPGKD